MTRKELYRRVPYRYLESPGAKISIYAIKCGEFVKIGIANNVRRRLKEIDLCNPYRATVALQAEVAACLALKVERTLHKAFNECRHRREWFRIAPKDVRLEFWHAVNLAHQIEAKYAELLDTYHAAREKSVKRRRQGAKNAIEEQCVTLS